MESSAIRVQVDRVLESPHFRNSKRSQAFLRYVVAASLDGHALRVKERNIGVEAFGRDPDYDTNQDPVVRNVATEVRKRLAQYYLESGDPAEIRIELPPGAYVPEFRQPHAPEAAPTQPPRAPRRTKVWMASALAGLSVLAAAAAWGLARPARFDLFWAPLLAGRETVQICVEQPRGLQEMLGEHHDISRHYLNLRDSFCMARMAALFEAKHKPYRMRTVDAGPYTELRGSPAVLIGYFNNPWTLKVSSGLRFYLDGNIVRDRQQPGQTAWQVPDDRTGDRLEDYAIVTRVFDPEIERVILVVAGMSDYGTLAAGEFVTRSGYLAPALQNAPAGWERRNVQMVIKASVVGAAPGPPKLLTTYFW